MQLTVLNVGFPFAPVLPETAGGAEQVLATLDEALVAAGHKSIVLAPQGSRCRGILIEGPQIPTQIDADARKSVHRQYRQQVDQLVNRYEVDVIHAHGVDFFEYIMPELAPATLVTLHLPLNMYPGEVLRSRAGTHLVCVSRSQARACPPGVSIERLIENGVSLSRFHPEAQKQDYVAAMGRICPEKGFEVALDAASAAGVSLHLAGEVFGYPEHERYFRRAIQPRIEKQHRFVGTLGGEQKRIFLARARALLVPSMVAETSSLVTMEALACGTPVIAFQNGALPELIDPGRTGFLVNSREEMAQAIRQVGELDPAECRREAEQRFSAEKMVAQYLKLYRALAITVSLH